MAVTLEPVVFRNGLAISALARIALWSMGPVGGVAVAGSKHPIAVLLHDGTHVRGLDPSGRALSAVQIEDLYPGAAQAMAAAWRAHRDAAFSGDQD